MVQAGDVIGGHVIDYVTPCTTMLNNSGQVAFTASYDSGNNMVVRADPLP